MKVLYGVQSTGNGHITRARAMARELARAGVEVDYLFSGRPQEQLFDMDIFGDYQHRTGITFTVQNGAVRPVATLRDMDLRTFIRDVRSLKVTGYDLILTDFEPVTAWAGLLRGRRVVGIGHQYAFHHPIPQHRATPLQRWLMRYFAPSRQSLGLHWHPFGQPILPPIAPVEWQRARCARGRLLVYLPFENPASITALLATLDGYQCHIFHPLAATQKSVYGHLHWHQPSLAGFQDELLVCEGVICNAGFELASETLQLGKKLLVKPLSRQPEQLSNALALDMLGYGHVMQRLDKRKVCEWLENGLGIRITYPNVAAAICRWLVNGAQGDIGELAARLWAQTSLPDSTPRCDRSGMRNIHARS